ncbi:hypothetical protein SHM_23590 [Spiroplasma ixodetis]|uniref:Uncharacterized protein n=1 Tax=Spiroplasma ixodetis TaxID=2141 RepID=A0ABM8BXW0_9MOLU|nr:hypothetical protein SHM_23590 [Spiroplasma ixodetis]
MPEVSQVIIGELFGTFILILLGNCVVANVLLKKRERTDVVNNIQICLKIIKLDENNFDFNMQLYLNLNTWKILVNNNTYFYNTKILIKASLISFILFFGFFKILILIYNNWMAVFIW